MEQAEKRIERRRYEMRGIAVPAESQGRGPGKAALSKLQKHLIKRYGEGWEVDKIYPGEICQSSHTLNMEEGHLVIFKRRRQLRDE